MRRREVIAGLAAAGAWLRDAWAQQATGATIAFLSGRSPSEAAYAVSAFRLGLLETGYVEGRNLKIEFRWADGEYDRLPGLAAELASRRVEVIAATGGSVAGLAAKAATATIPIVFTSGSDPVQIGLVASLNRPGGNVTGVSFLFADLGAKRLGLLRELLPHASVVGLLVNPKYPSALPRGPRRAGQRTNACEFACGSSMRLQRSILSRSLQRSLRKIWTPFWLGPIRFFKAGATSWSGWRPVIPFRHSTTCEISSPRGG